MQPAALACLAGCIVSLFGGGAARFARLVALKAILCASLVNIMCVLLHYFVVCGGGGAHFILNSKFNIIIIILRLSRIFQRCVT